MKKEKYVMNVTKEMLQDIQLLKKDGSFYDACLIYAKWPGYINKDKELENFIATLRNYDVDYYEIYTYGQINFDIIQKLVSNLEPKAVIPLDYNGNENSAKGIPNLRIVSVGETVKV